MYFKQFYVYTQNICLYMFYVYIQKHIYKKKKKLSSECLETGPVPIINTIYLQEV